MRALVVRSAASKRSTTARSAFLPPAGAKLIIGVFGAVRELKRAALTSLDSDPAPGSSERVQMPAHPDILARWSRGHAVLAERRPRGLKVLGSGCGPVSHEWYSKQLSDRKG